MRHTILVIMSLLVAGLAVGCASTDDKYAAETKQGGTAAEELDKAKAETKEAAQASQDYAYTQKAELIDKMNKELAEIQEELDRLSAKVESTGNEAKADAKARLEAVREKWAQAKKQLDRTQSATESNWDDVKAGFKKSYSELKDSFGETRQWLSDKIES